MSYNSPNHLKMANSASIFDLIITSRLSNSTLCYSPGEQTLSQDPDSPKFAVCYFEAELASKLRFILQNFCTFFN